MKEIFSLVILLALLSVAVKASDNSTRLVTTFI